MENNKKIRRLGDEPDSEVPNYFETRPSEAKISEKSSKLSQCDCEYCHVGSVFVEAMDRLDYMQYRLEDKMRTVGLTAHNVILVHDRIFAEEDDDFLSTPADSTDQKQFRNKRIDDYIE